MDTNDLFKLKQKFLQHTPHPKVIKSAIRQLSTFAGKNDNVIAELAPDLSLMNYLDQFIQLEMKSRLSIANAKDPAQLYNALDELSHHQRAFHLRLAVYIDEDISGVALKISDPIDPYAIKKWLQEKSLNESEIKDYLRGELKSLAINDNKAVLSFVRAKKIIQSE